MTYLEFRATQYEMQIWQSKTKKIRIKEVTVKAELHGYIGALELKNIQIIPDEYIEDTYVEPS